MSRKCEKHGMILDLFCLGHNIAVCARCSQSDHFKCPQFVSVEDAAKYANPLSQRTARSQDDSNEQRSPANILKTVNQEKNTFTNYVKAAIESGEQNTFTKFLTTNVTRSENDRIEESMKKSTPLATSRDFQVDESFGENSTFQDPSDPDNLESYRPLSENFHHVSDNANVQPKETTLSKAHANSKTTKSEVGQLLEDVKKFSKGLSSRDDVGITLDDLILKIDRTLNEIAENFENTRNQKKSIEYQIKEIRARLNTHLDNMERKLLSSLESKFSHCEASVVNVVEKLQKGRIEINHMKSGKIDNPNSPFQANTLLAIRESDKQMRRMKRSVYALTENVYAIDIDVKINQDLNIFINEVQAFGEVTVNSRLNPKISQPIVEKRQIEVIRTDSKRSQPGSPSRANSKAIQRTDSKKVKGVSKPKRSGSKRETIETTKRLETVQILPEIELGQHLAVMDEPLPEIITTSRSGISGIRIMQKKKVKIGHKWTSSVSNCKMLPNGRLIFIDTENKRLVIHNKDTYVYRNLRVHDSPRDFTILDNDRIAVTFGLYIEVLNILTSRIEKRIQLEFFECNGISFMDGKYYIYGIFDGYLLSRHGIQIMDMHGRIEDRLPITRVQTIHHSITTWRGRIYYTGYSSVSCCMTSGEELWVFKHDTMDRPKSVTVDDFGNVFASFENENKIVVISVDGLYSKEFELRKHDLYYGQEPRPISVYFDTIESALIVCNANKDHSVMYFVKYD